MIFTLDEEPIADPQVDPQDGGFAQGEYQCSDRSATAYQRLALVVPARLCVQSVHRHNKPQPHSPGVKLAFARGEERYQPKKSEGKSTL